MVIFHDDLLKTYINVHSGPFYNILIHIDKVLNTFIDKKCNLVIFHDDLLKTYINVHSGPFYNILIHIDKVLNTFIDHMFFIIYCWFESSIIDQRDHEEFHVQLENCQFYVFSEKNCTIFLIDHQIHRVSPS